MSAKVDDLVNECFRYLSVVCSNNGMRPWDFSAWRVMELALAGKHMSQQTQREVYNAVADEIASMRRDEQEEYDDTDDVDEDREED